VGETGGAPYLDPARDRIVFPAEVVKADEDQWVPLDSDLWAAIDALPRSDRKVFGSARWTAEASGRCETSPSAPGSWNSPRRRASS